MVAESPQPGWVLIFIDFLSFFVVFRVLFAAEFCAGGSPRSVSLGTRVGRNCPDPAVVWPGKAPTPRGWSPVLSEDRTRFTGELCPG